MRAVKTQKNPVSESSNASATSLERLVYRVARLGVSLRFTYAFHAREVRFEYDASGDGFTRVFPETFSFRPERHDPAELYLQLEDLWSRPELISSRATKREAEDVMARLCFVLPGYLERVLDRLEEDGKLTPQILGHTREDILILARIFLRFMRDKGLADQSRLKIAAIHLKKIVLRTLESICACRVEPEYLECYVRGETQGIDPNEDLSDSALFFALCNAGSEELNRRLVSAAELAYFDWLENICLDETNQIFESERKRFASREDEVLAVVKKGAQEKIVRGTDFSPFLRRPGPDSLRILGKLERWFFRHYDVHHAACMVRHQNYLRRGIDDASRVLSRHSARNYGLMLLIFALPFLAAIFGYQKNPLLIDVICSFEVLAILVGTFWFFLVRFCWKRDLSIFFASVPRIMAGIIVGYAPVFLIDEVWDLAGSTLFPLFAVSALLGFTTFLYLYVEVRQKLGDVDVAFQRARAIFFLGILEAFVFGIVTTSLIGQFMVSRNWADPESAVLGQLPRALGIEPLLAFPTAVFLFTFLSFFIGTFLQLLWEDLPITEPL